MDLTAGPVVAGTVLLAVAAVLAVPWTWDRWRWPRPARSALVLLATTGVLLAAGAVVNRQAGFFPTVASLASGQGAVNLTALASSCEKTMCRLWRSPCTVGSGSCVRAT